MRYPIGMRIPPRIGEQGIHYTVQWAAEAGLDLLDVPQLTPEIKQACDARGIGIGSVDAQHTSRLLSRNPEVRSEAVESFKLQIDQIAELGGRVMFLCLVPEDHTLPRREGFAIWKETFPEIVRHAEQQGVYMAIEGWPGPAPHYSTLGCTPEMWRAMFEAIPSKHFGLNYDPSHLVRLGIDYLRALTEFGDRIVHCHGKDTEILHDELYECGILPSTFESKYAFSEGSWRYTIPGHGDVEWNKVAVRLEQIGYQGAISIELEDHRYWGSIEAEQQGIVKAASHLAQYFR
ncbi:sugar phosphate isomerase/epimerase [Paenibacillus phyllosphaerae]|uniref:Sugar phosphate isomerase/epimerase n=1 Tax=Paenibacillus phyllosphaerae TaxID=274593 RepID=A0A7W5FNT9_9BACL|nr:sugar phosphate isomerase/epimerase [Paenibacillus phyllosphaerae]MBB3111686.1 sugar phosphate isomerase/epimerase [Paenibacillus phyllosphaerae]